MSNVYPESECLIEIAESFRKRSRALKHHGGETLFERTMERFERGNREKLEITYRRRPTARSVTVRLFVWSDRWAWIDAREPAKHGWKWEWTAQGRVSGPEFGRKIVAAFEATIGVSGQASVSVGDQLDRLWKPILATGPAS